MELQVSYQSIYLLITGKSLRALWEEVDRLTHQEYLAFLLATVKAGRECVTSNIHLNLTLHNFTAHTADILAVHVLLLVHSVDFLVFPLLQRLDLTPLLFLFHPLIIQNWKRRST